MLKLPIYLDNAATTPVDPRVVDVMLPYLREHFGNPASNTHDFGRVARRAAETAREQVAALVGADPRDIIWTSGATESNNLALKGAAHARGATQRPPAEPQAPAPSRSSGDTPHLPRTPRRS